MILHILLFLMVPIKLREDLSDVVDNKLRQLTIVIFNYKAEKLAIFIVNNVSYLFFEREWWQLFKLEFSTILFDFKNINFVLHIISLLPIIVS